MGKRREARELAVRFLYKMDVNPPSDYEKELEEFLSSTSSGKEVKEFAMEIVKAVEHNKEKIDEIIRRSAINWDLRRIAVVDRNILRMGVAQLLYMEGIPPIVAIDESVELAKMYGTSESGKFVNGILDRVRKDYAEPKG